MRQINHIKSAIRDKIVNLSSRDRLSDLILKADSGATASRLNALVGMQLAEAGKFEKAICHLKSAVELDPDNARNLYQLALTYQRSQQYENAITQFSSAIERAPSAKYYYHRGRSYEALEMVHDAIHDLFVASQSTPNDPRAERTLRELINSGPLTVAERTQYLTRGVETGIGDVYWSIDLGRLSFEQKLNDAAVYWYGRAETDANSFETDDYYKFGLALHSVGETARAKALFIKSLRGVSKKHQRFGLATLHSSKGNWWLAKEEYLSTVPEYSDLADYYYQTGMAHDRIYEFDDAAYYYSLAIAEDPNRAYWHWRSGYTFEKLGLFKSAAERYMNSARLRPDLHGAYHAGRMFVEVGDSDAALECFELSPELDEFGQPGLTNIQVLSDVLTGSLNRAMTPNKALELRTAGMQYLRQGEHQQAYTLLDAAERGLESPDSHLYAAIGFVLSKLGRPEDAVRRYMCMLPRQRPDGVGKSVKLSRDDEKLSAYLAYREELPVDEFCILYEVGHGASIGCNPFSIYRQIANDPAYHEYHHVWVINESTLIPDEILLNERVILVRRGTYGYFRKLATAKYLINNTSFGSYFIRRNGQRYLNTWHGTPHKTLGKSVAGETLAYGNIARNLLQATHISLSNRWTAEKLLNEHCVQQLVSARVAINGSPRLDSLFVDDAEVAESLRRRLGLIKGRPLAVYVPTWRGTLTSDDGVRHSAEEDRSVIQAVEDAGYQVLYSAHRFVYESGGNQLPSDNLIPLDVDLYAVLKFADVLVTDYSSVWFDFLPTRNPIVFYYPDRDSYEVERGLYEIEVPGPITETLEDLTAALTQVSQGQLGFEDRLAAAELRFAPYEDGSASKRVAHWFLDDGEPIEKWEGSKRGSNAIFRQSFIPNGIATSFRALASELGKRTDINCHVLVDRHSIVGDQERHRQLKMLPKDVAVLPRTGRMMFTPEERWIERKAVTGTGQISKAQEAVLGGAYSREFARLFGASSIDMVCEFDGYSRFWSTLIASAPRVQKKSIYLHNNMRQEHSAKHPELKYVFECYRKYESLISVSESVNEENRADLSRRYSLPPDKFQWANNVVDAKAIVGAANESVPNDLEQFISEPGKLVVAVGRLSVEKGHDRLISELSRTKHDIRLLIVGGGPHEAHLNSLVRRYGLSQRVRFAGHLANPYPVMARADVVTLLSRWEGQGLTLLEAMLLEIPVVATDIPGPRSIINDFGGLLVPNTEIGIRLALDAIGTGTMIESNFDSCAYNNGAVADALDALSTTDQHDHGRSQSVLGSFCHN